MSTQAIIGQQLKNAGAVLVDFHEFSERFLFVAVIVGRNEWAERQALEDWRPAQIVALPIWRRARWYHHIIAAWRRFRHKGGSPLPLRPS